MRFSQVAVLLVTLAGSLWLGGCGPSTAGCLANCDAQEAAGCDDGLSPQLCRMVCDAVPDVLDAMCAQAFDDLQGCLAAEGYVCSDGDGSGAPIPANSGMGCLPEAQAAQPCNEQFQQ